MNGQNRNGESEPNEWPTSGGNLSTESSPKCRLCVDTGWITLSVGVGDPRFGQASLCACQQDAESTTARLFKAAALPNTDTPKTFATWELRPELDETFTTALKYAAGDVSEPFLVMQGPHGTGRSHLIEAIGRSMLGRGWFVRYLFVPDWLDILKTTFDSRAETTFEGVFQGTVNAEVLLVDDLGAEKATEWTAAQLTRLVDSRYRNNRMTVVTTNDDEAVCEQKQGGRLTDRLYDSGSGKVKVVVNDAASYRTGCRRG